MTLLRSCFPRTKRIDLLKTEAQLRYLRQPSVLRDELRTLPEDAMVIIDEVQKFQIR